LLQTFFFKLYNSFGVVFKIDGFLFIPLFVEVDAPVSLTDSQQKLLERWARLSEEQQAVVFALIEKM